MHFTLFYCAAVRACVPKSATITVAICICSNDALDSDVLMLFGGSNPGPNVLSAADAENGGLGYRKAAEPFDRKPFVVALAATWDKIKVNKTGTDLKPGRSPVKVTLEQAAFTSFKVNNVVAIEPCSGVRFHMGCQLLWND